MLVLRAICRELGSAGAVRVASRGKVALSAWCASPWGSRKPDSVEHAPHSALTPPPPTTFLLSLLRDTHISATQDFLVTLLCCSAPATGAHLSHKNA